jgi:hypothetical protein
LLGYPAMCSSKISPSILANSSPHHPQLSESDPSSCGETRIRRISGEHGDKSILIFCISYVHFPNQKHNKMGDECGEGVIPIYGWFSAYLPRYYPSFCSQLHLSGPLPRYDAVIHSIPTNLVCKYVGVYWKYYLAAMLTAR